MTKDEIAAKNLLAPLGCALCYRLRGPEPFAPVEFYQLQPGDAATLVPVCPNHHRGRDGMRSLTSKAFRAFYGFTKHDLVVDVRERSS